jgi:uncharacterized protein (TIGR02217 family)
MSTVILPSLAGLGFDVTRTPVWDTTVQQAISGKETRIARQTYPRWKWELTYSVLRSGASYGELQQLAGLFNARLGMFDTFLYTDADDNGVTAQAIGTGDGATTVFPLVRSFGGFVEPVLAPNLNAVFNVYLNGVVQGSGIYSAAGWGGAVPGTVTFITPPASGVIITADFSYYWPCRMSVDSVDFTLFLSGYYKAKKFSFISVKN